MKRRVSILERRALRRSFVGSWKSEGRKRGMLLLWALLMFDGGSGRRHFWLRDFDTEVVISWTGAVRG